MKTPEFLDTGLIESSINSRLSHKTFLELSAKTPCTKTKKYIREVDKASMGVLTMFGIEDYTAQTKISLYPEFVAFAFHLYGLSRKLFTYIIFYEMNNDDCRFKVDSQMRQRFRDFCSLFGEKEESETSISQAVRSLIRKNTLIFLEAEEYMMNPLIAGGANENKRRKLIDIYCELLQKKGFDASIDFFPRYQLMF